MRKGLYFMISLATLAACSGGRQGGVPAIDLADLDTGVSPGDDFYLYANGGWMKANPLGAEYARYGTFDVLRENNVERLNELFASMTTMKTAEGSSDRKIVDLYKQGLDSTRLNSEGATPILGYLKDIYAAADKKALAAKIAELHVAGEDGFFGTGVDADLMDSDTQVLYMGQGGLGIGDRDYYIEADNADIKAGYLQFLTEIFTLAGIEDPASAAASALRVEDRLAEYSWTSVQNRDYTKIYNPMGMEEIVAAFPGFDFARYFETAGRMVFGDKLPRLDKVIVQQPSYFKSFAAYYAEAPIEDLKNYLAGQFIKGACGALSDAFYDASFEFYSHKMSGITEQKPRWKRAMAVPNSILGEAVGKMYVEKYFPESSKQKVSKLVSDLQVSLGEHIDALEWMSGETKKYAREKLAGFTVKIGYPDKWKDYGSLDIDPSASYYENLRAASKWYTIDNLSKIGKPTDKDEWGMTPQTVNAYYNPTTNEICFPAAILQPPFFNPDADDAVNYGAIGVVIGHEMTHGFDDQGRMFDKDGNMTDWWTEADAEAFKAKAEVLAAQFDAVEILPGVHANGQLELGENIADHGGVSIAYTALHNALGGVEPEPVDGFSADQRFFLGYAHVWAQNITDEERARLNKLDVHALGDNRVNVTLRNFPQFFAAFGIKEGDKMFRPEDERVHIW